MPIYATAAELATYMHPDDAEPAPVPDATVLLRAASGLVLDAAAGAVYSTDGDQLPTLPRIRQAMREATLEQASAWSLAGIDPRKGSDQLPKVIGAKSQGSVSVQYVNYAAADEQRRAFAAGETLTREAWAILDRAGLIVGGINIKGNAETFAIEAHPYNPLTGVLL